MNRPRTSNATKPPATHNTSNAQSGNAPSAKTKADDKTNPAAIRFGRLASFAFGRGETSLPRPAHVLGGDHATRIVSKPVGYPSSALISLERLMARWQSTTAGRLETIRLQPSQMLATHYHGLRLDQAKKTAKT